MATLTLITHAHTQVDPATDAVTWRLSAAGETQAAELAGQPFWATVDRILVSSEAKTRLTVAPVLAQRSLPIMADARFAEAARPGWCDDYAARVAAFFAEPEHSAGGWEPAHAALARFLHGLNAHIDPKAGEHVALVAHGLVLSLYRAHLLGLTTAPFEAWRRLEFAAVAHVDLAGPAFTQDFAPVAPSPPRA